MKLFSRYLPSALLLGVLTASISAHAGQIALGSFGPGSTTQTYTGLGLPFTGSAPVTIGGFTYSTDTGTIRYLNNWNLAGIAGGVGSDSDQGFINIDFNGAFQQAGIDIGVDTGWTGTVDFFQGVNLLGAVNLSGNNDTQFAGWQDAGGISSIKIFDTETNGRIIIATDLITNDAVGSAPDHGSSLVLLALGAAGLFVAGRKLQAA